MQTYTVTHHLDGHEVATYEPRDNHDAIKVQSPDGMHYAALILGHTTPAPLRLAFLRSLAHAAEELAEQIELIEHPCQRRPHYGDPCDCEARLALVVTHTRTSTPQGPDYCAECSEAISEWVPWPCERSVPARPDIPTGTEYDLYADKDRGTALADQHIAEMKVTAGIALATTDSEYGEER